MNKKLVKLIKNNPVEIAKLSGFEDMTELHNEWLKKMIFSKRDETLLAHRGSYKTTCLSVAIAIMLIIYPDKNIIFLRKTDDDTTEVINQVENLLLSPLFNYICYQLYGIDLKLVEVSNSKITTNLKVSKKGNSQLLGIGVNGSLTGKHADIVITDDIVNLRDRVSRADRKKTKGVYQELQNVKNRGGRFLNTGTPWHKEDAISTLMPNVVKYDCYSTGLISKEQLKEIRESMEPSLFAANYEMKHIASDEALFSSPNMITDSGQVLENGVAHIDAAYNGSDYTAMTFIKKKDNKFYVYGTLKRKHVDDCLSEFFKLHKAYRIGTIYCEDNGDKGYLKKEIAKQGYPCSTYHEKTNKYIKISTYLRKNWKDIYFLDNTDPEYLAQILDYTENAEHDDAPDSLASIIRKLNGSGWGV